MVAMWDRKGAPMVRETVRTCSSSNQDGNRGVPHATAVRRSCRDVGMWQLQRSSTSRQFDNSKHLHYHVGQKGGTHCQGDRAHLQQQRHKQCAACSKLAGLRRAERVTAAAQQQPAAAVQALRQ
jgi:hypothetical protein